LGSHRHRHGARAAGHVPPAYRNPPRHGAGTAVNGLAIVAAAFLLSWCSEAAQVDVSQGLAIAVIAFIAVLPEYAVDVTFAWKAGQDPRYAPYAIANMTGANRVLIGLAWPLIFGLFWLKTRRRVLFLERGHSIEILTLVIATVYAFNFLLKREIGLIDTVVLSVLFLVYLTLIAKGPDRTTAPRRPRENARHPVAPCPLRCHRDPVRLFRPGHLCGRRAVRRRADRDRIGVGHRRVHVGPDRCAHRLRSTGVPDRRPSRRPRPPKCRARCIDLVQSQPVDAADRALPVAYGLSGGDLGGLPLDDRQMEEVFLTAAQSAFAVVLFARLNLTWWGAALLLVLFSVQFMIPGVGVRLAIAWIYLALALLVLVVRRTSLRLLVRTTRECAAHYARRERSV
jgi:cation:H+ antiporter